MSEIELMSIYLKPYLIELVFDFKKPQFNVVTYKFEGSTFILLSETSCSTYSYAVLMCFNRIVSTNLPMKNIVNFHRHDSYNHSQCIEHLCINQKVCGKFIHAYFNKDFKGLENALLKYMWVYYL